MPTPKLKVLEAAGAIVWPVASWHVTVCPVTVQFQLLTVKGELGGVMPIGRTSVTVMRFAALPWAVAVPGFDTSKVY